MEEHQGGAQIILSNTWVPPGEVAKVERRICPGAGSTPAPYTLQRSQAFCSEMLGSPQRDRQAPIQKPAVATQWGAKPGRHALANSVEVGSEPIGTRNLDSLAEVWYHKPRRRL